MRCAYPPYAWLRSFKYIHYQGLQEVVWVI